MSPLAFGQCVIYAWAGGELSAVREYSATKMTRASFLALLFNGVLAFGLVRLPQVSLDTHLWLIFWVAERCQLLRQQKDKCTYDDCSGQRETSTHCKPLILSTRWRSPLMPYMSDLVGCLAVRRLPELDQLIRHLPHAGRRRCLCFCQPRSES